MTESRPSSESPVAPPPEGHGGLPDSSLPAILMVDDHRANLLALEAVLAPLGYRLEWALSGREAITKAAAEEFVLIVMDVHMPDLDGYQTVELLRSSPGGRDVPIVFLTAVFNLEEHVHRGYTLGAADYITKPFDPVVVRSKVSSLVSLYMRGRRMERAQREEMDWLKDMFLGAVGHDLRNPLQSILFAARLIEQGAGDELGRLRHLRVIQRAAQRMDLMVEDILDLTRDKFSGGIPLKLETADLSLICRSVTGELQSAHPERHIELETACDARGQWDPARLARVVSNLLHNAVHHTTEGAVQLRLTGDRNQIHLVVHNRGPAISPDVLPHIFEPFRRGQTRAEGLGLGLYIAREIVRAHGGRIDVASSDADGTSFTVSLPRTTPRT